MQHVTHEDLVPWYRQFWPWFLIALPASAVVAGFITLYIAISNRDSLVVDDYYKQGLAINQRLKEQQVAKALNLTAHASLDPISHRLTLVLTASHEIDEPTLKLSMVHATQADQDQIILLKRQATNTYTASLNVKPGKWHMILAPVDEHWIIKASKTLPQQQWLLTPNV